MCVSVDMKVYVCDEYSEMTVMLRSGDRVMDDDEGVGLSGCHHTSQTEQTQSFRPPQLRIRDTRAMISRFRSGWTFQSRTTLCTLSNMKKWLGAAKLSTSSSTHSLSALDEPQARKFAELASLHGTCG